MAYLELEQEFFVLSPGGKMQKKHYLWVRPLPGSISESSFLHKSEVLRYIYTY